MSDALSRRGFFAALRRPFERRAAPVLPPVIKAEQPAAASAPVAKVAIVQGRFCIALTSFCAACVERCPVPGAMKKERGMPMVVADVCTGCGICHDVCPAPRNAVLMLPRRQPSTPQPA